MEYFPEPIGPNPKFPCRVCQKTIAKNHRKVKCHNCNFRLHIKCNKTDVKTYNKLNDMPQLCIKCQEHVLPFHTLTDDQFCAANERGSNLDIDKDSSLFPSQSMKIFFNEISTYIKNQAVQTDSDNIGINCDYVDIDSFNYTQKMTNLSLLHLNIASLTKHKEELDIILSLLDFKFDFIGITETKIKRNSTPTIDISIEGYEQYLTETDGEKGGSLL